MKAFSSKNEQKTSQASAQSAGLRFITDTSPGFRRISLGRNLRYVDASGKAIRDKETLTRIKVLAIPPAWTGVWICPIANGHLQATGRDSRGRKQYRYHAKWRIVRDETKFDRVIAFGKSLPQLRARLEADLALRGLPRLKVLATVVHLLATTLIRVGNEEYARTNGSFGLTTLCNHHIKVEGETVHFAFRGKSGIRHRLDIHNARLARIIRKCRDLPGHELFQYLDELGNLYKIDSADVNEYLREVAGEDFTAKDFRTWAATVLAAQALRDIATFKSQAEAKRNVIAAIESVAKRLGNTTSVCRKSYIHPAVVEAYLDGSLVDSLRPNCKAIASLPLENEEKAILGFLQSRVA